jgi:malate:Na+ symporter
MNNKSTFHNTVPPVEEIEGDLHDGHGRASLIAGIKWPYFVLMIVVLIVAGYLGALPDEMISGFAITMVLGGLLWWLGSIIPVIKDYGAPTVFCVVLPAVIAGFHILPPDLVDAATNFTSGYGFINFYISALIAGSILGMPRKLLISAGARYAVPLLGMIVAVLASIGGLSALIGRGFWDGIFFIAAPIIGGGVGAGAVPMSEMYGAQMGVDAGDALSKIIPAVIIGNIFTIIFAGVLNGLGKNGRQLFKGFNGEGNLLRMTGDSTDFKVPERAATSRFNVLIVGVIFAALLYILGQVIGHFVPSIHPYAWTILAAALIKIFGLLPQTYENAASDWFAFVAAAWTPALLVGISFAYIDTSAVVALVADPLYIVLILCTVIVAGIVAGVLGYLVKMNYIEASISVGLGMTDMGGTGDVAVLSAANRFELMPFLQISSRLGGALVLLILSFLLPFV